MKKGQKNAQIILISIGLLLILITYFYYPYAKKVKFAENQTNKKELLTDTTTEQDTSFENVEYKGLYDLDKIFTVNSEKAHILKEKPDIVYMTNMHVILYLNDGRVINIRSLKGRYKKKTYDCFFENDVVATDEETKILADNLDLLATENSAKIYNNVIINYPTASLQADVIDYDFTTKHFSARKFGDQSVRVNIIK